MCKLTPRELSVLRLMIQGACNKEISRTLGISYQTTKNYITQIYEKLDTQSRTQAVCTALRNGIINLEELDLSVYRRKTKDSRG